MKKDFPIEECARLAYGDMVPKEVTVVHEHNISRCMFKSKRGTDYWFIYDHSVGSFLLIVDKQTIPVRHQRELFKYLEQYGQM